LPQLISTKPWRESLPFTSVTHRHGVMDIGAVLEVAPLQGFFKQSRHERAKLFLSH
jgi:hypothetical protein